MTGKRVGFHIWEAYSPWSSFGEIAEAYLDSYQLPDLYEQFINEVLGLPYKEDAAADVDEEMLLNRREDYSEIPDDVLCLTCGVDIQDDRIETELVGHGLDGENWSVEKRIFYGLTSKKEVWKLLDDYLLSSYETESGYPPRS